MSLTKTTYSMITGAPVNILDYGAVGDGVTDNTTAIQAALTYASSIQGYVVIPTGTFLVSGTLDPANANIMGLGGTIKYTGSSYCLNAPSVIQGVNFSGPGNTTTSIGIQSSAGFKNQVVQCTFQNFGTGIQFSGSGQKIQRSYFQNCGTGVHIVKYPSPSTDPTTTFTSEKNWYDTCTNGLWIDSTGASSGMISSSSIDDIWQLCQGSGLRLESATFPFTLINPHTEQNSNTSGWYAFKFVNSNVIQIGGYKSGTNNANSIDSLTTYQIYAYSGILAQSPFNIGNYDGSITSLQFDPSTNITQFPCNPSNQKTVFVGGGYNNTNSARFDMYGGIGDSGYTYGTFIESQRTTGIGNGVNLYFGCITRNSPSDTYTRQVLLDYTGNLKVLTAGKGVTLVSPNGSVTKTLTIDNSGNLVLV